LDSADPLARFRDRLSLPLIAAPMFLVSGVDLVVAACRNGVIGAFPTVNCRSPEQLDAWLGDIETRLRRDSDRSGKLSAPICPNLIVHRSNARLEQDLRVLLRHKPEIVITSVGSPAPVLAACMMRARWCSPMSPASATPSAQQRPAPTGLYC
jgi:nitronate monooxygenase